MTLICAVSSSGHLRSVIIRLWKKVIPRPIMLLEDCRLIAEIVSIRLSYRWCFRVSCMKNQMNDLIVSIHSSRLGNFFSSIILNNCQITLCLILKGPFTARSNWYSLHVCWSAPMMDASFPGIESSITKSWWLSEISIGACAHPAKMSGPISI